MSNWHPVFLWNVDKGREARALRLDLQRATDIYLLSVCCLPGAIQNPTDGNEPNRQKSSFVTLMFTLAQAVLLPLFADSSRIVRLTVTSAKTTEHLRCCEAGELQMVFIYYGKLFFSHVCGSYV